LQFAYDEGLERDRIFTLGGKPRVIGILRLSRTFRPLGITTPYGILKEIWNIYHNSSVYNRGEIKDE